MEITIDTYSGFCFGVVRAIEAAENNLQSEKKLYCLGDIVHNNEEVKRLSAMGLQIISHDDFKSLNHAKVLIRAHGEPPETYQFAKQNHIELIDTTCVVVLKLQQDIKKSYEDVTFKNGQILIFGKAGHAEVIGLLGQTNNNGLVISSVDDINKIDFNRPAKLYSQTTQSVEEYKNIIETIQKKYAEKDRLHLFTFYDTICKRVANRANEIRLFAARFDKVVFVSGEKSSNGLYLYDICKKVNPKSFFIYREEQLNDIDFKDTDKIGICGATSSPMWLMKDIAKKIKINNSKNNIFCIEK